MYTANLFMYHAAPGVGKGSFQALSIFKACKKTSNIFDKKMYTVSNNV